MNFLSSIGILVATCHGQAKAGGWWTDLQSGLPKHRNHAEMLMLMVSELIEANDGLREDSRDEHLPHHRAIDVELADFFIRAFDYAGGTGIDLPSEIAKLRFSAKPLLPPSILNTISYLSYTMEHDRKGRAEAAAQSLASAIILTYDYWFDVLGIPDEFMLEVLQEKLSYNQRRADHKIENRQAPGGKAY